MLPYEALFRFAAGPILAGGHTIRLLDNGLPGQAVPIGKDPDFPWSLITGEINAAALASNAALTDQLAAATQAATDAKAAQTAAEAATAQRDATITQLQAQLAAISQPDAETAGYTVPGIEPPLVLDDRVSAQARFTSLLLLVVVAKGAGAITDETPQTIADRGGALRQVPTGELLEIMLGYGRHCQTQFAAAAAALL